MIQLKKKKKITPENKISRSWYVFHFWNYLDRDIDIFLCYKNNDGI